MVRYLAMQRTCYPSKTGQLTESGLSPLKIGSLVGCSPNGQSKEPPDGNASGAGPEAPPVVSEFAPKPGDSEAVAQWRGRMNTDPARAIYKDRAATAECVNAQARNRGLLRMPVRGLAKVKCVVRLYALAHNLMRMAVLAPELIGWGTGTSAATAAAA